ncbi:protein ATP6V1FNB [Acipenser oxyrinchus oxyrinchus]|uniref:Protein ATP6V1FNB n=1 Tax=Acipenser oxyrinchus oxyrinchus TaxID=40147 RepID=A0AAD8D0Y7_ACIOX|nr:protein ATP6V1FNB [Acipenser oxyrinchus oxyrinchus]
MRDLLTTQKQNCYRELIEKEAYTRLAWKAKYGQEYSRGPSLRGLKASAVPKLPAPRTVLPPVMCTMKPEELAVAQTAETGLQPDMRPVTPQIRSTLYQGFSKEGKGRNLYLQQRSQKSPDEKFQHPVLSSWEYGWRLGELVKEVKKPVYGRSGLVKDTFYARNGIFNSPAPTDRLG